MKVLLFGGSGMVGRGVLHECLIDPAVESILSVGRSLTGLPGAKFHEIAQNDLTDLTAVQGLLQGYDACFFCLGVSSVGRTEEAYRRVTYDLTLAIAETVARLNPGMTFVYVSGAGTDSTERGRSMWARVKGQTENALLRLPFRAVYLFRPGAIQPLHGIRSKTTQYRVIYALLRPLFPVLRAIAPNHVTTSEKMGRAMLRVARQGAPKRVLENRDINALGA